MFHSLRTFVRKHLLLLTVSNNISIVGDSSPLFFMKKKIKKSEQKIADCDNIYDMIEILQCRIDEIENEHTQLIRKMGELNSRVDDFSTNEN